MRRAVALVLTLAGSGLATLALPASSPAGSALSPAAKPTLSLPGGWITGTATVTVTAEPDATIRFTTDGSTPSAGNGTTYTVPLEFSTTTTLRAVAVKDGWADSPVASATYLVLDEVLAQGPDAPPGWPVGPIGDQVFDYGFNQAMVAAEHDALVASFSAAPTLSIITDQGNLTDPTTGIYNHPSMHGSEWERPASVELIDGADGFQINAGLRIKGGYWFDKYNRKHSFQLSFAPEYEGPLTYDVFGSQLNGTTTDVFTELEVRSEQNLTWHSWSGRETFMRDRWLRDSQAAIGDPSTRSRWVHLFLNGQYWGLYMVRDLPTAGYAAQRWGGNTADYDVVADSYDHGYEVLDGDDDQWTRLWRAIEDGVVTDAEYATIDSLVDLDNLADFIILDLAAGNTDATPAVHQEDMTANNWYAIRGKGLQFQFFTEDGEKTLGGIDHDPLVDVTGPHLILGDNRFWREHYFNPGWLHEVLLTRAEYRTIMRARAAVLLADGSPIDDTNGLARWQALQTLVDPLVVAEAARWGDVMGTPYTRQHWLNEVAWVSTNWFPGRTAAVRAQFEVDGWWLSAAGIADEGYAPAERLGSG